MENLKKIIVGVLCFVLTLNSCIYNAQAAEDTVMEKDFIYVDGIKYDYVIDKDGTIKIETYSSKVNGKLILNSEANGVVQVENTDGKLEKYEIEVNDLTIENVDIDIFEIKSTSFNSTNSNYCRSGILCCNNSGRSNTK